MRRFSACDPVSLKPWQLVSLLTLVYCLGILVGWIVATHILDDPTFIRIYQDIPNQMPVYSVG